MAAIVLCFRLPYGMLTTSRPPNCHRKTNNEQSTKLSVPHAICNMQYIQYIQYAVEIQRRSLASSSHTLKHVYDAWAQRLPCYLRTVALLGSLPAFLAASGLFIPVYACFGLLLPLLPRLSGISANVNCDKPTLGCEPKRQRNTFWLLLHYIFCAMLCQESIHVYYNCLSFGNTCFLFLSTLIKKMF